MRKLVLTVVAGCMSAAVAGAFAQSTPAQPKGMMTMKEGTMMMKEGMVMAIMPDGRMSMMQKSDKMMSEMMMKEGKPMTGTHMMMMSGGKVVMMEDKKMADGKMMSERMMMKDGMMKK